MSAFKTGELAEISLWTDHLTWMAMGYYEQGYLAAAKPYVAAAHQGQLRLNQLLQVELDQSGESNN